MRIFTVMAFFTVIASSHADQKSTFPKSIGVVPIDKALEGKFTEEPGEDGDGDFLPPSVSYFKKGSKDFATFMTVTDLSFCKKTSQKATCESFVSLIRKPPTKIGSPVTRIGGSGYQTVFLKKLQPIKFDGVDSHVEFIGGDSQDPPTSSVVVYIFAKKGTNLIQITGPVGDCEPAKDESEYNNADQYYKQRCLVSRILGLAAKEADALASLFKLK